MSRENLLQQAEALGAVIAESASWSFDQNGNMSSKQWRLPGGNSASKTLTYNDSDRATNITQSGITPSSVTMTYDANGNLTSDSLQRTFTWNVLDQLTNFTRPTVTASFSYDPLGRRTSLINGSTNKSYLYDGQNMLKDGVADFLNGANIDEPLEYESSTNSWNYFQDHLGSSTQLRNTGDGASVQRYDYKSYGKLEGNLSNTTSTTTALTYTGREDDNTGLYYYRARYYDPNLELFISEDPLGDAQRYVGGNPLSYTDPLGLEANINLFKPKSLLYNNALNIPESNQYFTVAGHGNARNVSNHNSTYGIDGPLRPITLARMIQKSPKYLSGRPVILYSCNTGMNSASYAQELSKELNAPVIAPSTNIWILPSGYATINSPSLTSPGIRNMNIPGRWNLFQPINRD